MQTLILDGTILAAIDSEDQLDAAKQFLAETEHAINEPKRIYYDDSCGRKSFGYPVGDREYISTTQILLVKGVKLRGWMHAQTAALLLETPEENEYDALIYGLLEHLKVTKEMFNSWQKFREEGK